MLQTFIPYFCIFMWTNQFEALSLIQNLAFKYKKSSYYLIIVIHHFFLKRGRIQDVLDNLYAISDKDEYISNFNCVYKNC